MIARAANAVWRRVYARYVMASAVALCADIGLFLTLLRVDMSPVIASTIGYIVGLGVHWLISSRLVFTDQAARGTAQRTKQKMLFIISALVGLAITGAIVGFATARGLDPRLAKLCAIFASFQTTYMLRRSIVFV
ncbi:MAG: GtrA family protein [Sphingobium sp.]